MFQQKLVFPEEYLKMNDRFIKIMFKLNKNNFAELDQGILWTVSEILYNFDNILPNYTKGNNIPVPETFKDKFSMIEQLIDQMVNIVLKAKSGLEELFKE